MAQRSGATESCAYRSRIYYWRGGLLLILVESFSGWPEVIRVPDKKGSTIKQILTVIFSRSDIPKGFGDEDLSLWLENRV